MITLNLMSLPKSPSIRLKPTLHLRVVEHQVEDPHHIFDHHDPPLFKTVEDYLCYFREVMHPLCQ